MKNSKILALKYRPKKFEDLVGQSEVSKTIYNSIKIKKIPNAFLFHGIRGTGKTSLARIVAKSLNCKNGVENLCTDNFCESCQSIIDSNHLDVIEQDCATATGIDSVRDLIEFCRYPPSTSNFKVFNSSIKLKKNKHSSNEKSNSKPQTHKALKTTITQGPPDVWKAPAFDLLFFIIFL